MQERYRQQARAEEERKRQELERITADFEVNTCLLAFFALPFFE